MNRRDFVEKAGCAAAAFVAAAGISSGQEKATP
ncbi:MAG: twin-arginine translocation signal domain-containing protein, partial [Candidatus Aminicenantales bacterium]